jgi:iron complex transport system permease protein
MNSVAVGQTEQPKQTLRQARTGRMQRTTIFSVLIVLVVSSCVLGIGRGALSISPSEILSILARRLGFAIGPQPDEQKEAVLWSIRLPRVTLSLLVGAALGISGAALQGVFRNPLADPGLIGVSSGAALGAVAAIVSGLSVFGLWTLPIAAFSGALLVSLLVFKFAHRNGRVEVVTLVLCGVAVNALAGAGIGLLTSIANDAELRDISFWQLGSVGGASWPFVAACAPFVLLAVVFLPVKARQLDLLVLGEREAKHLGVNIDRVRLVVIGLAALATGASVAVAGILGFVGLVVPHLIRLIAGPSHRTLLPASALGGAGVLTFADLFARTAAAPRELPLGVMTALIGAPMFLWLIRTSREQFGGFA